MDIQSSNPQGGSCWYKQPGIVDYWFYGVFEGGGAKGVAYAGALQAMKEKKCWFRGVAGASAGAITAALVAAGMDPDSIEEATEDALKDMRTKPWAGLWRLREEAGYFSLSKFRKWLNEVLALRVEQHCGKKPETEVTFEDLYRATDIELNIVAADLSLKRQIIFSHLETPNCTVAEAVIASSSIPFAFPSGLLEVHEPGSEAYHHTIVDGGVWSNFPMFIFSDSAFRAEYQRSPAKLDDRNVLGFLLKDTDERPPPKGSEVRFAPRDAPIDLRAREWYVDTQAPRESSSDKWNRALAWTLAPFALLGRSVEWNSGMEPGRWPKPRSQLVRNLVDCLSGVLGGLYPPVFGMIALLLITTFGITHVENSINGILFELRSSDWTTLEDYMMLPVKVLWVLLVSALVILIVLASALGILGNFFLLRSTRRLLYGLVTTYIAGPGAPAWAEGRENVIALPIPRGITTLSFGMLPEERIRLIAGAREATLHKLNKLLIS